MDRRTVICVSDSIISPLGMNSEENYAAVYGGESAVRRYDGMGKRGESVVMSRLDREKIKAERERRGIGEQYSFFEGLCIMAALDACASAGIDASRGSTLFVVSTTKANVSMLGGADPDLPRSRVLPGVAARAVSGFFRNPNAPLVVCNACISGVSAQIQALRALRSGRYDTAVVVGADEQSEFIYSGFLSFKALSDEPCRPFDADRKGLNPGEAAAAMVLKAVDKAGSGDWTLVAGASRNDANHISGPSRTGEGSYLVLKQMLRYCSPDELAFINVHGTATAYNDEMESIAIDRAGLIDVPVTGLKGCYGHTMGAAGLLESILAMRAVEHGCVLATRGFSRPGVSRPVNVSASDRPTARRSFIKLISGFGGSNAALLYRKEEKI